MEYMTVEQLIEYLNKMPQTAIIDFKIGEIYYDRSIVYIEQEDLYAKDTSLDSDEEE